MKNELGIEIKCENCWNSSLNTWLATGNKCELYREDGEAVVNTKRCRFWATDDAYEARIKELQKQVEELEAKRNCQENQNSSKVNQPVQVPEVVENGNCKYL
jgi:hypothetical protein